MQHAKHTESVFDIFCRAGAYRGGDGRGSQHTHIEYDALCYEWHPHGRFTTGLCWADGYLVRGIECGTQHYYLVHQHDASASDGLIALLKC